MKILFWAIFFLPAIFFLLAAITSFLEKEIRAGNIFLLLTMLFILAFLILNNIHFEKETFITISISLICIFILLFFVPIKGSIVEDSRSNLERFHEADAILSRRRLEAGTENYQNYYKDHPDFQKADDKARSNPGLLSKNSKFYDPLTFSAAKGNFIITDHLHMLEEFLVGDEKVVVEASKITPFLKKWMLKTGAHSVGFTNLKDYHLYSHKGRGKNKGQEIINDLPHAIAITVEMDHKLMRYAPQGPTVMESSEQYLGSGVLATKLALFIKELGYNAKAHIDGNYELICPLVASDAGLGVIGRMGLLMTPRLGPRVRIAVVTTDLPMEYPLKKNDYSVIDFCEKCKKCALNCPANAIPNEAREFISGGLRWRVNSEKCYNYWTVLGTDCGKCMISCPYAHPDSYLHSFVRWGIKNNLFFRRMAVKLDDIFYGRKPAMRRLPDWLMFKKQK